MAAPQSTSPLRRIVAAACWLYLAAVLLLWLIIWLAADSWWVATILLFGAQWLWALPLVVLIPAAIWQAPRHLWVLLLASAVLIFPVLGFNLPWAHFFAQPSTTAHLRVLTCNTHWDELDPKALAALIQTSQPDIVALQEFDNRAISKIFGGPGAKGWHTLSDGDELTIATRFPVKKVKDLIQPNTLAGGGHATCYAIDTPGKRIYFVNLHLASPHPSFNAIVQDDPEADELVGKNIEARREQARLVSAFAITSPDPVLLAGDFNTPISSNIYRQHWAHFENAFTSAGLGFGYTYYYGQRSQVRIDHLLGNARWKCQNCWIAPSVGSKHLPVVADWE